MILIQVCINARSVRIGCWKALETEVVESYYQNNLWTHRRRLVSEAAYSKQNILENLLLRTDLSPLRLGWSSLFCCGDKSDMMHLCIQLYKVSRVSSKF
jgi:hypothetical protein